MMRIGSMFTGAGGLDMAVAAVFGGETVWHAEVDQAPSLVLAHHFPRTHNIGDVTAVNWRNWRPALEVDVLCGGFPCQDVSLAGRKAGLGGSRSGLWFVMRDAIAALKPSFVVVENVLGLATSGAIDQVLSDLVNADYAPLWAVNSAASIGAPHRRRRVFIVARQGSACVPRRVPADDRGRGAVALLPTPEAKNAHAGQDFARAERPNSGGDDLVTAVVKGYDSRWSRHMAAISHWEQVTRPAPHPTVPTCTGGPKINPAFVEWMMGWPAGWVTAVPGVQDALFGAAEPAVSRSDQLKICGNGVVPQQAEAAIRLLLDADTISRSPAVCGGPK